MKIYHKVSKFAAYRVLGGRKGVADMRWFATRKPGDLISGCTHWPFNSRVAKITLWKWQLGPDGARGGWNKRRFERVGGHPINPAGYVVNEVGFEDNFGHSHTYPGGGCVERPLSVEKIREIILSWAPSEEILRQQSIEAEKRWLNAENLPDEELAKIEKSVAIWCRVRDGLPVCDEFGMKLDELR